MSKKKTIRNIIPFEWKLEQAQFPDYAAVAHQLDAVKREADRKWGRDRLPNLVSPETAKKFEAHFNKLTDAVNARKWADAAQLINGGVRAYAAMDNEATRLGAEPHVPDIWYTTVDGAKYAVVMEITDTYSVPEIEGYRVISLQELIRLNEAFLKNEFKPPKFEMPKTKQ